MPTRLCKFQQSAVWPGKGGVCFAACAMWCRLQLSRPKDFWNAPKGPADADKRLDELKLPETTAKIASAQTLFAARAGRLRPHANKLGTAVEVIDILKKQGHGQAATAFGEAIEPAIDSAIQAGIANIACTIKDFGLTIQADRPNVAWTQVPANLQVSGVHLLHFRTSSESGHAIAAYRTSGLLWSDYYVFDPNFGEFLANGDNDLVRLLEMIRATADYHNPKSVTIKHVT